MTKEKTKKKKAAPKTAPDTAQGAVDHPPEAGEASGGVLAATAPGGFPIVGIGASAGGLAAFEAFFSGMPAIGDPGMAFVLVQHLAPDHKSILADLIRRSTQMQVFEVEDGMEVHPNCAYIIPPGRDMAFLNGALQLLEPSAPRGQRLPIDFFFRSLAQDQHERAIGIVLSGTGSDGTLGVRAIKGEGGMVMAQNPASTEFDGMPRSAVATGLVDFVLPPAEMPAQLIAYTAHAFGHPPKPPAPTSRAESAMNKIFVLLRSQVGHDFSQYKPASVQRRIERRMAVQQIDSMDDYVKFIRATPTEAEALFRDMLIGVTSFFRDPVAFKALQEQVVPKLFAGRPAGAAIRVWVPGCSTGEEAYSLAILLRERLEEQRRSFKLQVFATDIDSQAVAVARAGIYPASISTDITAERLARFFTPEPGDAEGNPPAYRIRKNIRDLLVFSEQNVIRDPPFSKLDLISCRNLLIYMGPELQKKLILLFHYAISPGGFLFLGTSETVGEHADLFAGLDRKAKIYQRKEIFHGIQRAAQGRFLPPVIETMDEAPSRSAARIIAPAKLPLRELTETALLQEVVPAGALVTAAGDILYLHGRTGMYLEPAPGEAGVNNIIKMAREGLKHDLAAALNKAAGNLETFRLPGLRVKTNGGFGTVDVTVRPVDPGMAALARGKPAPTGPLLFLVILQEAPEKPEAGDQSSAGDVQAEGRGLDGDLGGGLEDDLSGDLEDDLSGDGLDKLAVDARITALKQALRAKEEYLQALNEELETSNEELKSSNEEMQSVNEELQSANEELETSKEELQSVNEELVTVNSELQTKVADLSQANNDMNNLLAGTGVATVFVDHQLRILRFTPAATRLINLILSDVGRPVGHIVSNLKNYDRLSQDVQAVLDTLVPKEEQVRTAEGKWYTLRILPYRTLDNVIEGAVITFVDITEYKQTQEARLALELKYRVLYELSPDAHAIAEIAEDGRDLGFVDCNQAALDLLGMTRDQLLAANVVGLSPKRQPDGRLSREKAGDLIAQCLSKGWLRFDWLYSKPDGKTVLVEITMTVHRESGKTFLYSVWRDLTGLTRTPPPERPKDSNQGEKGSREKVQASG
jgi:two-component system, chemotaxis family, CheB/CheR fusion protein